MSQTKPQPQNDCVFCQMLAGEIPYQLIEETEQTLVILSLENHPLIIPKQHLKNIYPLHTQSDSDSQKLRSELLQEVSRIALATEKGLEADGTSISQLNGSAAGQEVFHLHFHVLPRYKGKSKLETHNKDQAYKEKLVAKIKAELDKLQ